MSLTRRHAWLLALPAGCFAWVVACVGPDAPPPADVSCLTYCADIQNLCTGDDQQFPDNATCQRFCATIPTLKGISGNTVECRQAALSSSKDAVTPAAKHLDCNHAGVSSGACGSACEGFCTANIKLCGTQAAAGDGGISERYPDLPTCLAQCAKFPDSAQGDFQGKLLGSTGDNLQCRTYHLELSQTGIPIDKTTHCPHTTPDNKAKCGTVVPPADAGVDAAADAGASDATTD